MIAPYRRFNRLCSVRNENSNANDSFPGLFIQTVIHSIMDLSDYSPESVMNLLLRERDVERERYLEREDRDNIEVNNKLMELERLHGNYPFRSVDPRQEQSTEITNPTIFFKLQINSLKLRKILIKI